MDEKVQIDAWTSSGELVSELRSEVAKLQTQLSKQASDHIREISSLRQDIEAAFRQMGYSFEELAEFTTGR